MSDEIKAKISNSEKGKIISIKTRNRISKAMKGKGSFWLGKKLSDEHKGNLKKNHKGFLGRKHSISTRILLSSQRRGERASNWKGGITPTREALRKTVEYKLWRESVFERDNYTCMWCGIRGGSLQADHIKPFAHYPELRFAIDNGRTLCVPCHKTTNTFGGRARAYQSMYDSNR